MELTPDLSPREIERRKKLSETQKKLMKKRREQGLKRYWRKKKKEREKKEKAEAKLKERKKKLVLRKPKKVGRKKKRGPKLNWYMRRKKALEKYKKQQAIMKKGPYVFMIMLCRNGNRYSTIGRYRTSEEAYRAFDRQKEISDNVVFPRALKIYNNMEDSIDECVMIQKTNSGPTLLRNEYGKLVKHETDLEGWEIVDKFRNNVEETFWVWGYDNRKDRKTFMWIYDEILIGEGFDPYEFRRVFTYKNKLFVRMDDGTLNMIICKSSFDSVRMYNEFQRIAKKNKVKELIFIGDRSEKSQETEKLENEIIEMTGWTIKKIRMDSTTYCQKN